MKFKLNVWGELTILSIINIILLCIIIAVYNLTTRLPALILFIVFLGVGVLHSFKKRFEETNFFLSKKGKFMMFVKSCLPYVLRTMFFVQCSLLVGWILLNI